VLSVLRCLGTPQSDVCAKRANDKHRMTMCSATIYTRAGRFSSSRAVARRACGPWLMAFVVGFLITTTSGCTSQQAIEKARARGAQAGNDEGRRAGEAEGFIAAADAAHGEAYRSTFDQLFASGQYNRRRLYNLTVVVGFFVAGIGVQWVALYLARRMGRPSDIDRIILPKEMRGFSPTNLRLAKTNPKLATPASAKLALFMLLALLPMAGCKSAEEDAWQRGYDANRSAAYQEGWVDGAARGRKEGEQQGRAAAQYAAENGEAWQLYSTTATWALIVGLLFGLSVQYSLLVWCRKSGRLPELWTVAFVPAMTRSVVYQLLVWLEDEMRSLNATHMLQAAQIQSMHTIMLKRLEAISSLDELTQVRLVELADREMMKIMSASASEFQGIGEGHANSRSMYKEYLCPSCGGRIRYKGKKGGKTVNCPYDGCIGTINVPKLTIDNSPANASPLPRRTEEVDG
jgi:DNA-directed RNA polymerase subunit RPC12/RpoP